MTWPLLSTLVVGAATAYSFRPTMAGRAEMWLGLLLPYAALSLVALGRMHQDGVLGARLRARSGDVTLGAALAGLLLAGVWVIRTVTPPASGMGAWTFRIFVQVGTGGGVLVPLIIALLALLEELVWRGLVLDALGERLGTHRAWGLSAALYALAHVPTAVGLGDPDAGYNPLLIAAALGAGAVWGLAAARLGRLPPVIVSHVVFGAFAPALAFPALGAG